MKRLAVVGFACFALLSGACDDDDDIIRPDAGRDGSTDTREAGSEAGGPVMCVGALMGNTRATLAAAVNSRPAAMCGADADLDLICTADLDGKFRGVYVQTCVSTLAPGVTLPAGVPTVVSCVNAAVLQEHPNLSAGCRGCYTALVGCVLTNCSTCASDPNGTTCTSCRQTSGCLSTFFTCSGLPGVISIPDAGVDSAPDRSIRPATRPPPIPTRTPRSTPRLKLAGRR